MRFFKINIFFIGYLGSISLIAYAGSHSCIFSGCEKTFDNPSSLARHARTHTGERPYRCTFPGCVRAFTDPSSLARHAWNHTRETPYRCTFPGCVEAFTDPSTLARHARNHTRETPYRCTFPGCVEAFTDPSNLARHARNHTGKRPYRCTFQGCVKAFTNPSNLARHARTHTGERPYRCTFPGCVRAFTDPSNLAGHAWTHTGERPYRCTFPGCVKAFTASSTLSRHAWTHTGERRYRCTFPGCVKAFTASSTLGHACDHIDNEKEPNSARESVLASSTGLSSRNVKRGRDTVIQLENIEDKSFGSGHRMIKKQKNSSQNSSISYSEESDRQNSWERLTSSGNSNDENLPISFSSGVDLSEPIFNQESVTSLELVGFKLGSLSQLGTDLNSSLDADVQPFLELYLKLIYPLIEEDGKSLLGDFFTLRFLSTAGQGEYSISRVLDGKEIETRSLNPFIKENILYEDTCYYKLYYSR